MFESDVETKATTLAVACPGGMARQFRVQVRDVQMPSQWRLVESFRDAPAARQCAQRLLQAGTPVRVVDCRALPTAA